MVISTAFIPHSLTGDNTLVQIVRTSAALGCCVVCLYMLNCTFMVCFCLEVFAKKLNMC